MKKNIILSAVVTVIALMASVNVNAAEAPFSPAPRHMARIFHAPTATDVINSLDGETAYQVTAIYQNYLNKVEKVMASELSFEKKQARIDDLKETYTMKLCTMLDSWQTEVTVNTIPVLYLMHRAK